MARGEKTYFRAPLTFVGTGLAHKILNLLRSMKSAVFSFLILFMSGSLSFAQKTTASYERVYEPERDGRPSKCDCDYHKNSLVLMSDSTFTLEEVRGRLDPKTLLTEKGHWKIENDSVLVLTITQASSPLDSKTEKETNPYHKTFTIGPWGTFIKERFGDENWEGRGLKRTTH